MAQQYRFRVEGERITVRAATLEAVQRMYPGKSITQIDQPQAPARKAESSDQLYSRRAIERATYEGPGPGIDAGSDKADADFARRAAETETSRE